MKKLLFIFLLFSFSASADQMFQPPEDMVAKGKITYCATIDNPPRAFADAEGNFQGFEIDLGEEIADRLGLKVEWEQMKFDGLIPSVQGQVCDAIVQELFIKPTRVEVIDMVAFGYSAQSIVVNSNNNSSISGPEDLSGLKVAVPNGTSIHNILMETNDNLSSESKKEIDIVILETTTDSFGQLQAGQVDAVGTTNTAAAYYVGNSDGKFKFAGPSFGKILDGIGLNKDRPVLNTAIIAALNSILVDGTYSKLLSKWNLEGASL
jgi:polar amino acid transport system substrate-binding protein